MSAPLAERLRQAFGGSLRTTGESERPRVGRPDGHPADLLRRSGLSLPGRELRTPAGCCLVYEERLPLDHHHGGVTLGSCLDLPRQALACLTKNPLSGELDFRRVVFLDTETTGLAGGTGTTAFLVGIAYFDGNGSLATPGTAETPAANGTGDAGEGASFVIRQYFMRDFAEEHALLLALAETLAAFSTVVTFNGKSFDLPLLETRSTLARLRPWWRPELHLDLLHPSRRLWKQRLASCSLGTLEAEILGHSRQSDVPSWMIPSLYASYLRFGETGSIRQIFDHNRHDLLSLAALLARLAACLANPVGNALRPLELAAVARIYDELGLREAACAYLEAAVERCTAAAARVERERLQHRLALAYKRAGRRDRALSIWRELASGPSSLAGLIELAKHHEHYERDAAAALEVVEQALIVLELREVRDSSALWRSERAALERRYARLLRKRGTGR